MMKNDLHSMWGKIILTVFILVFTTRLNSVNAQQVDHLADDGGIFIFVPNAFTPDGDGINDYFQPSVTLPLTPREYTFTIINRWGEIVFQSDNIDAVWDGSSYGGDFFVGDGIYVWQIKLAFSTNVITRQGTVHIYR